MTTPELPRTDSPEPGVQLDRRGHDREPDQPGAFEQLPTEVAAHFLTPPTDLELVISGEHARARATDPELLDGAARFLAEASAVLASSLDYEATLATVARLAVPFLADYCVVDVFDANAGRIRRVATAHADPARDSMVARMRAHAPDLTGDGVVARVIRSGRPEVVPHLSPEVVRRDVGAREELLDIVRELQPTSYMCVPLVAHGAVGGSLLLVATERTGRHFTPTHQRVAEELARRAALAVDNARLYALAERLRLEAEAALAVAERASRAKSEFLAVMSHELRTPLNAIAGYVQLLEMEIRGPLTEQQHADLRRIRRAQGALRSLIDDVLDFSRLDAGRMEYRLEAVDVAEVLATAEAVMAPLAQSRSLVLEVGPAPAARVMADARRLQQIVINLLSNAVKFTDAGGMVRLNCVETRGKSVEFRVSDTGRGIHHADASRIFEPFEQGDAGFTREPGGVGLGLAISRRLAREMGGELELESSVLGVGSTFRLSLPVTAPEEQASLAPDRPPN